MKKPPLITKKSASILTLILFFSVLVILIKTLVVPRTENVKNDLSGEIEFNTLKYENMLSRFQYGRLLKALYLIQKNNTYKTQGTYAFLTIAATRKARFFIEANKLDRVLGIEAFNAINQFEKVGNTKYHYLFSAIYFYLSGKKEKAVELLNTFLEQKVPAQWKHDARILKNKFQGILKNNVKMQTDYLRVVLNSFPETKIDSKKAILDLAKIKGKHLWRVGAVLQHSTLSNIKTITDEYLLSGFDNRAMFKEKIAQVQSSHDSLVSLYTDYYNPLLFQNLVKYYSILAQHFYQKMSQSIKWKDALSRTACYEYVKLLMDLKDYVAAEKILKNLLQNEENTMLKMVFKIDLFFCKTAQKNKQPNFESALSNFHEPILQSYFIFKMAQLGYFINPEKFHQYFKYEKMSRNERLTCAEYLGNFYLLKKDYDKAQQNYQRRLLGGSYDITRNEHIFLLKFTESFYYNKINMDNGIGALRNIIKEYPELVQLLHNYELIYASIIFG